MPALVDAVPTAALLTLLVTAYRHPRGHTEALIGLAAAAATVASGALGLAPAEAAVRHLGPVVVFLAAILVVADICARSGLFAATAQRIVTATRGSTTGLFTGVFVLAAAVTAVLSLDATVVLLTPVVVAAAASLGVSRRPGSQACLRMANSASLLFPVSNLTNLLAMRYLDLTFLGFAARMLPVLVVVLLVEYAVLRLLNRRDLAGVPTPPAYDGAVDLPLVPCVVVGLMLVGFAALSPLGVDPAWVATGAAVLLSAWAGRTGLARPRDVLAAAHPGFAVFVLGLGVVVAAVTTGYLGDVVAPLVPHRTDLVGLLVIALVATALANLLTNLAATLLLVPLVAPLGSAAVLAALLGLNIGSGLTYTGSLANLLWRRTLHRQGTHVSLLAFHRLSLVATPLTLAAAVATLALVT